VGEGVPGEDLEAVSAAVALGVSAAVVGGSGAEVGGSGAEVPLGVGRSG